MNKDKKGRNIKDDSGMQQDMASAGFGTDQAYEPYVFYDFEVV